LTPTPSPAATATTTPVPLTATALPTLTPTPYRTATATTAPVPPTATALPTLTPTPYRTATASATPAQPTAVPTPAAGAGWGSVSSWVYQLSGYPLGRLDQIAASGFDLAVVDLARDGCSDFFTRNEVWKLKAAGMIALAYFEIGAIEDYRPEWPLVPDSLKLGAVGGWPSEQYVKYWDDGWWPIVKGRIDQAIAAGFDGAYLDMVVTYEEIPADSAGTNRQDLAAKMVDLIARVAQYARSIDPSFKVVPQNSPELRSWPKYLPAVSGIGMEELYFLATDKPCSQSWCLENRANAAAIRQAGKLVLTIDYANVAANVATAYTSSRAAGFVPYVSVRNLDVMRKNPGWDP
jgi:cysteinyl-tRNA synthetase